MDVKQLDAIPEGELRELLVACCGAPAWVAAMLSARPFGSRERLLAAADGAWAALPGEAIADAIARHPRLGESRARAWPALPGGRPSTRERAWSAGEQAGAGDDESQARAELARGNAEYERRFGHTFILCATGLSGADMVRALRERLGNDPATERAVTARELHRITRLRLEKLLAGA